ncbi:hypothetical protein RND71_019847 [Anisodus tanguticus]|uniref:Uncharacterized protein n=1 Tax=Anisodus tanguticus TaxID=243964 RepID=A0AAE1VHT8_9SOLA|nr:hypothetical protein RND71_019847 [Anisodus tanguticus]
MMMPTLHQRREDRLPDTYSSKSENFPSLQFRHMHEKNANAGDEQCNPIKN